MNNLNKKYVIRIPKDVFMIYSEKKKILFFKGPLGQKLIKLKLKTYLNNIQNLLIITSLPFFKVSGNQKKLFKSLQGTTTALIKQTILEISNTIYKKLEFIGVGFKIFPIELFKFHLLQFKLGQSHSYFFKITNNYNAFCLKTANLYVFGNSYQKITHVSARFRSYKKPEPYKGKGILYENENIILKQGKKA